MIVLGIDIGVTGAIAAIGPDGVCHVEDLPTMPIAGNRIVKRKIDAAGVRDVILRLVPAGETCIAVIEDVHAGMGRGVAARSSLDLNRGRIEAVLELLRIQTHAIQPRAWKKHHAIAGGDKADSLFAARERFPELAAQLKRAKDHNRADASLIALYGREVLA